MKELEYPFDCDWIMSKKRSLKKKLKKEMEERRSGVIKKRIAILGGSTTADIKDCLELFLLNESIEPEFYESEYNQYYQDIMFPNSELESFQPDLIYIHTSNRNITDYPEVCDSVEQIEGKLESVYQQFETLWGKRIIFIIVRSFKITWNSRFIVCLETGMSVIIMAGSILLGV